MPLNHEKSYSAQIERQAAEIDGLKELLACAYQLAGTVGAPVRFLDAFSRHEGGIDDLLPVSYDEIDSCARADALQAKLDALMLEYCPDEMTPEQIAAWGANQVATG